jgi:hypothetical protein
MCEKCEEIDRRVGHLNRMIAHVDDPQTVAAANTLIEEMKAMKAKLHSNEAEMEKPKQMQIVRRAYQLWQEAGEPQGKDEEFYYLAEQQLRDELLSSPLPTPGAYPQSTRRD